MLVLEGLVDVHRTIQLQLLQLPGWSTDLDYCDIEWFAFEMNRDHLSFLRLHPRMTLFFWAPKSLWIVIAALKLKDAHSLEGKL